MDSDPAQKPYRSPAGLDDRRSAAAGRRRTSDLALAGMFLGIAYGAATGAAVAAGLDAIARLVAPGPGPGAFPTADRLGIAITSLVAVATFGALIGMISGAVLGVLQGFWTARSCTGREIRLIRRAALCWAMAAVIWCLLIDQNLSATENAGWVLYLALLAAPMAAGIGGARLAVRLVEKTE